MEKTHISNDLLNSFFEHFFYRESDFHFNFNPDFNFLILIITKLMIIQTMQQTNSGK